MINPKHLKHIKDILDYLNQEWNPPIQGVPSQTYMGGKLVNFYAKTDPYFTAYLSVDNVWWLCVSDYWVWQESHDTVKELVDCVKGCKIIPCYIHPIQCKQYKDMAKQRKTVLLFIGKVSWAV